MRELKNTKIIAVDAVEYSLKQALPLFLSGLTAGMVQREPQIRASFPAPEKEGINHAEQYPQHKPAL